MSRLNFKMPTFACDLECGQCEHVKDNGQQCKNRVCYGTPICWIHTIRECGVRLKQSTIPGIGKGLFAMEDFGEGGWMCPYNGEETDKACLNQRCPGDVAAPCASTTLADDGSTQTDDGSNDLIVDGACCRGIGTVANGKFGRNGRPRTRALHNAEIDDRHGGGQWIHATKAASSGEETFVHYGDTCVLGSVEHRTKRSREHDARPC